MRGVRLDGTKISIIASEKVFVNFLCFMLFDTMLASINIKITVLVLGSVSAERELSVSVCFLVSTKHSNLVAVPVLVLVETMKINFGQSLLYRFCLF